MWWRKVEKSEFARDEGRCWKDVNRYRWNSSVPADKGIGFRCEARSFWDCVDNSANVSEIVVNGEVASRLIRDSIAAMGGVMFGSLCIRLL